MGTRSALIITTNYTGIPGATLAGCDNDGTHMAAYLESLGFDDVARLREQVATRRAIESGLEEFIGALGGDDLGVVHYSGHGTEGVVSLAPGAPAVKHEGLVPYDFRQAGILWDSRVREILSRAHRHARVVVILDSCFSGGMYRFAPPLFDHYRAARYLPPEVWLRAEDVQAVVDGTDPDLRPLLNPGHRDQLARQFALDQIAAVAGQTVDKAYPVVLLAASKPGQVAWCADIDGIPQGAFTAALLKVARGQRRDGTVTTPPRHYLELMYGRRGREGVTTNRVDRPGWLPAVDADQDPTLHGTGGRVTWDLFSA
jgi:hypothetical protein